MPVLNEDPAAALLDQDRRSPVYGSPAIQDCDGASRGVPAGLAGVRYAAEGFIAVVARPYVRDVEQISAGPRIARCFAEPDAQRLGMLGWSDRAGIGRKFCSGPEDTDRQLMTVKGSEVST